MDTYRLDDCICAISSGLAPSGIGIVRMSGEGCIDIADKIIKLKNGKLADKESHTIHYGHIYDGEKMVDEIMVILMRAPHTYTKEDVVEINCHGGPYIMNKILYLLAGNGARIADRGEFTKRAFLNGRIDLSKAEAVMDLIASESEYAASNSISQIEGSLYKEIVSIREDLLYNIAYIEAGLDDPEHIDLDEYQETLVSKIKEIISRVDKLISSYDNGKIIKEGITTGIIGKPNVGKSSLLNYLVGHERAIVTDVAGTTRDTVEETVNLDGILLKLIDTAGIRESSDVVEAIGINKAKEIYENADLILLLLDNSVGITEDDKKLLGLINNKKAIILINKTDVDNKIEESEIKSFLEDDNNVHIVEISVKNNIGVDKISNIIKEMFYNDEIKYNDEVCISNVRHKTLLDEAKAHLEDVVNAVLADVPEDIYSVDMYISYAKLGEIIGMDTGEDVVNEIFSKFCMGK